MQAVIERALQHDLFAQLDVATRSDLQAAFEVIDLRPGDVLFREGSGFGVLEWEAHAGLLEIGYEAGLRALAECLAIGSGD